MFVRQGMSGGKHGESGQRAKIIPFHSGCANCVAG